MGKGVLKESSNTLLCGNNEDRDELSSLGKVDVNLCDFLSHL